MEESFAGYNPSPADACQKIVDSFRREVAEKIGLGKKFDVVLFPLQYVFAESRS
jgi:hypothetical protein